MVPLASEALGFIGIAISPLSTGIGRDFPHRDVEDRAKLIRYVMPIAHLQLTEHWRDRAAEMRAFATETPGLVTREAMLRLADNYERLAYQAETRAKWFATTKGSIRWQTFGA